jgi:hypothetical protein
VHQTYCGGRPDETGKIFEMIVIQSESVLQESKKLLQNFSSSSTEKTCFSAQSTLFLSSCFGRFEFLSCFPFLVFLFFFLLGLSS